MEDYWLTHDHKEEREHNITVMRDESIESLNEEIELERIDYETMLEEIRI